MRNTTAVSEGSTFSPSRPVEPMASNSVTAGTADTGTDALLQSLVRGKRGEALRAQLTARYPEIWVEEVEEAIQYACKSFLSEAEGIRDPGQVYTWIRTAALRYLNREANRRRREIPIDPVTMEKGRIVEDAAGPAEELIELEDDADLEMLVGEVSSSLSERKRDVLALYGAGYKRPQIADRLGVPERVVKRDLLTIMDEARATLARLAGGGCERGEPLVMRMACGISSPDESAQARKHLSHCRRCEMLSERLIAWREKVGAMLPAPVAEGASPGVVRRIADSAGEKLSALKQHVLDGSAQVKQHAASTYYRAVDPTPLAAARPGTVGAVIASCLAIGGGAATYCVNAGVDPLGAAQGLIAGSPESESEQAPLEAESTGPTYTPAESPAGEEPEPAAEPTPQPEPEPQPKPQPEPEPQPADSFEPVTPAYQSSESESESSYETSEAPAPEPAPAPASSGPQFGGP